VVLACVSAIIYFPFFKVYEKQLLEQEAEEAQRNAEEDNQQVAGKSKTATGCRFFCLPGKRRPPGIITSACNPRTA
jgi:hypothetical protein